MLTRHSQSDLHYSHILPYGPVVHDHGVEFAVFSRNATAMRVLLYDQAKDTEPSQTILLDRDTHRLGDIWSVFVDGLSFGQLYHLQADGPNDPIQGHRFDPQARLIDPYARALTGDYQYAKDGITRPPKCVVVDEAFDWNGDRPLRHKLSESIIYEMHVRGFTQNSNSDSAYGGTYRGLIDKIPYLQSLGITAVELMPVHEFPTNHHDGTSGKTKNYWGYDSMNFFSPHRGYAFDNRPGGQVKEFKQMVRAFHNAGIEVILDVVYNHTCEGNENGPTISLKGLDNSIYYLLEHDRQFYKNFSGCGNSVNANHPVVRELILNSLRYWVYHYHIDGFRFDLASILSRDTSGHLVSEPPLIEAIAEDPMLADTKIIAEAWDAAGGYQVGSFSSNPRWAEWNGRYRDDVRRYWRGDSHLRGALAARLAGSSDVYQHSGRPPYCSVNFVTSHDGFTLADLVSYNDKHNLANGEENRDGDNNNYSFNYGVEGDSDTPEIEAVRLRQIKNFLTTLLLSQGVPMLVSGDECRRSQSGNNNAYCQDNELSWFDWSLVEENSGLVRLTKTLIQFRKKHPTIRREHYLTGEDQHDDLLPDVAWYNSDAAPINWHLDRAALTCWLSAPTDLEPDSDNNVDLLMLFNPADESCPFEMPEDVLTRQWKLFIDTFADSPKDVFPEVDGGTMDSRGKILLESRSMKVFVSFRLEA